LKNGASAVIPDAVSLVLGGATGNTGGTYDLNGFSETLAGLSDAGTGARVVTNGAASGLSTLTITGTSTFAGVIQDGATAAVALTKNTDGSFTLSGVNTFTGQTTVDAGTLLVSGSLNGTGSLAVNGGTLGGNGSITTGNNGNITVANGASIAPGLNAAGTLTLSLGTGVLDTSAAAAGAGWLKFELGGTSDRILLTSGSLNLGPGFDLADFTFSDAGGFAPGDYVLVETNNAITATFGPNVTGTVLGYDASLGLADGGSDLVLHVVPEPQTAISLLGGLGTLLGLQRFRRRSLRQS
jgi:autotransporter-associated beta strand protein